MGAITYHTGRVDYVPPIDPSRFTQEQRDAHARIYAETGSPIARWMAGLSQRPDAA